MPENDYNHLHPSHPKSTTCRLPTRHPPLHPSVSPAPLDNHHLVFTLTVTLYKHHTLMLDLLISPPTLPWNSPSFPWFYRIRHTCSYRSTRNDSCRFSVFRPTTQVDLTPHYYISCSPKLSLSWTGERHYLKPLDHLIHSFLKLVYRPCLTSPRI
jgi:hypothetical protein